jgi:hypothetical protein
MGCSRKVRPSCRGVHLDGCPHKPRQSKEGAGKVHVSVHSSVARRSGIPENAQNKVQRKARSGTRFCLCSGCCRLGVLLGIALLEPSHVTLQQRVVGLRNIVLIRSINSLHQKFKYHEEPIQVLAGNL